MCAYIRTTGLDNRNFAIYEAPAKVVVTIIIRVYYAVFIPIARNRIKTDSAMARRADFTRGVRGINARAFIRANVYK